MPGTRSANEARQIAKIILVGQTSRAKRKAGHLQMRWGDVAKNDLIETGTSWKGVKKEALNRLGQRKRVRGCVGLRQLGTAVGC